MKTLGLVLCVALLLVFADASPFNKYGRTCRDILCIAGQEDCVMEQDACTNYNKQCGSYPTCKRKASTPRAGCASMKCPSGHFCSIRQENCSRPPCEIKPVCIAFRTQAPPVSQSAANKPTYNSYGGLFSGSSSYDRNSNNQQGQRFGSTSNNQQYGQRSGWLWSG